MKRRLMVFNVFLFFLFVFLLPTQLGKHFFLDFSFLSGVRIDYLAPTLYLTDILAVLIVVFNFQIIKHLFKNISFYIFLNVLLLNILFSLSPYISLYYSVKLLEVFFLFLIFKEYIKKNHFFQKLKPFSFAELFLISFNAGAVIELFLSILQLAYKHAIQGPFYYLGERYFTLSTPDIAKSSLNGVEILRAYGSFSHPNSMAGFYLVLYSLVLTSPRFSKYIFLKYFFLIISSLIIFCTFSKIPIIIFLFLNFWYVLRNPKALPCLFCRISRIVVIAVLSALFLLAKGDPLTITKRTDVYKDAVTIFLHHPVFGTGLGAYLVAQNQFPIKYSYFFLQPVHDIFLLYLAEAGLILTAVTLFFLVRYLLHHPMTQSFFYVGLAVVITGSFDHYWLTLQQNFLLLPLLFALL